MCFVPLPITILLLNFIYKKCAFVSQFTWSLKDLEEEKPTFTSFSNWKEKYGESYPDLSPSTINIIFTCCEVTSSSCVA